MTTSLGSVLDALPAMIWTATVSGSINFVNRRWVEYTGSRHDETPHHAWQSRIEPNDLPASLERWRSIVVSERAGRLETSMRRWDGEYRRVAFKCHPTFDDRGLITGWCGMEADVSDFRQPDEGERFEEAQGLSRKNLGLIINTLPVMAWSMLPDGTTEFFNQQYMNYIGLTVGENRDWEWTTGLSEYWDLTDAVHPDDLESLAAVWQSIFASGAPGEAEARLRRYDGKYRWFLFRVNPLHDDAGNVVRWYGTSTDFDAQKRAEQLLRESERKFRVTIDTIPAMAWSARPDGTAEFLSQHYLDYIGLSAEDAQGWGWATAVHPDDKAGLVEAWQAIMASECDGEAEARLRRADGEYRWFLFRASPLRNASGNVVRWYGVNTDIDDRKRAETNLAREKHLLEMIVSGSPLRDVLEALCRMIEEDAPGCYCDVHPIDWNGPSIQYSIAPSLPATYSDPIGGLSLEGDLLPCAVAVRQKQQVVSEDMESDPRWLTSPVRAHVLAHGLRSVWSTPICAKDGRVLGTFCVYQGNPATPSAEDQDLIAHATHIASIAIERSRIEAALRRSETLLAEGQRLSSTGTFSWRVDTDEIEFSEELRRIFEFDLNAVVTLEKFRGRVHPEDLPHVLAQLDRVRSGLDYSGYEIRLKMPDDRVKYLRTFGRVVRHQDGRAECLAAVQDLTERRLAEDALSKARSELAHVARVTSLGALTASIAHEVNQPLSGIITNAGTCLRMLAADPPNMEGAKETARRTIRDGNRAADVIARLRALFSKRTAMIEPVDLNEAAREVIALIWSDLQRGRVVLRTAFADDLPLASGDRVQLQQVILNLLRNASDAMSCIDDRERRLLISTQLDDGDFVRLSVQDSGVGLETEDVERLFQSFYTTKTDGMGIGLSVSRSIIDGHNGRLWATSNVGPGATFSFSIPQYSGDQALTFDSGAAQTSSTAVPNV